MAGLKWSTPPQAVWPAGAEAYVLTVRRGVHGVCQRWAPVIENEMKSQAPWEDKTANARQTLYSVVEPPSAAEVVGLIELVMSHGMTYGAFLEGLDPRHGFSPTRLGRKYAIVLPTLDKYGPIIWADIRKLFS